MASVRRARYICVVPICPICRQSFDGRLRVIIPPHPEAFDSVECARRAAEAWGRHESAPIPLLLPAIDASQPPQEVPVARMLGRWRIAALAALTLAPAPASLAAGVGLLAAGTATSVYLWGRSPHAATSPLKAAVSAPKAYPRKVGAPVHPPLHLHRSPPSKILIRPTIQTSRPGRGPTTELISSVSAGGPSSGHSASLSRHSDGGRYAKPGRFPVVPKRTKPSPKAPTPSPPQAPKPKPPTGGPTAPTPQTPVPPTPTPSPPGPTEPPGGDQGPVGNPPPKPSPQPPTQPPASEPPSTDAPLAQRPGNGWGDQNHDHTGPPGQGNGNGNGHGH